MTRRFLVKSSLQRVICEFLMSIFSPQVGVQINRVNLVLKLNNNQDGFE